MDEPTWLKAYPFEKVLKKSEKDETIEVSSISIEPATAKGENYGSDMYRINVVFSRIVEGQKTSETKPLIVKVAPQGGPWEELISNGRFFEVEIAMMSETLPRMGQILEDKLYKISLSARCLHVHLEKPTHLIIEDLAPRGFRMADRQAGLDLEHCLLAMRNLAAFHASSVALVEKDPGVVAKYSKGMFHKDRSSRIQSFFISGTKSLGEEAAKWPELSPRIAEKILKLSDSIYKKVCELAACKKDDFNVITHGDFWVNNMLFRYDEHQKPIDHIFVDFQISNYGSPALDLLNFFGTSSSTHVRMYNRELVLREYYISLTETMSKLECSTKSPSFDDLKESLRKRALCEVLLSFTALPVSLANEGVIEDMNDLFAVGEEYKNPVYQGQLYRNVMTQLLPYFDSMGFLDV